MKCQCGHGTVVKDGRYIEAGYWRRRKCPHCGTEYTTVEQFCETIKQNAGFGKRLPPKIKTPPPVAVVKTKDCGAEHKPIVPKKKTIQVINARLKVEALREQRALEKL